MQQNILTYTVSIIFRLLWSVLLTFLSSFLLILIAVYGSARTITTESFLQTLYGLFLPLFLLFLFLTVGAYILSIAHEIFRPKFRSKIRARIEKVELETRALITQGFRSTTICLLIVFVLIVASSQTSYLTESARSMITQWYFPVYLFLIFSTFLSNFLVDRLDWAVYNLERFGLTHELRSLQKALKDYNRALGSTLSVKRLLTISQYVDEGFMIGSVKEKEDMTRQLHVLSTNLRDGNICYADRNLIDLSQLAEETVRKHREFLGFEARYPYRLRLWDTLRSSVGKVFPELMLVLIWIAVLMILSHFGITKVIFPP